MQAHERIIAVMKHYGLNKNSFSVEIGVTNVAIGKIVNDKRKPNKATLEKIVKRFPEINYEWLLTERGEMLISKEQRSQQITVGGNIVGGVAGNISGHVKNTNAVHNHGVNNNELLLILKDRYDYLQDKEKQLNKLVLQIEELIAANKILAIANTEQMKIISQYMNKIMILENEKTEFTQEIAELKRQLEKK
jgi:transcriptional regulator with XRE-family HTH domain